MNPTNARNPITLARFRFINCVGASVNEFFNVSVSLCHHGRLLSLSCSKTFLTRMVTWPMPEGYLALTVLPKATSR